MRCIPCILLALGASFAFGQPPAAPPAFEVASIKPSDPASSMAIHRSGQHIAFTKASLLYLITWAYDMHDDRIYGKPGWLDSVQYDIVANAPADWKLEPVPGKLSPLQVMMQTLLAERFKLAVHRETKRFPIYALVVAKGGPKFQLRDPPEEYGQNPFAGTGRGRIVGTEIDANMLANVLSQRAGRTVEDQTGLKGAFDCKLEWEPEAPPGDNAAPRTGPSLFTAIQEQLGLKLEPLRGEVEVLVIDHIEKTPTEN